MKKRIVKITLLLLLFSIVCNVYSAKREEVHRVFKPRQRISIRTISGDCIIKKGTENRIVVDLLINVKPEGAVEPIFSERDGLLKITERWSASSSSGNVLWTLTVPQKTEIVFKTASGDLSIDDINSLIEVRTASGDVDITACRGEFKIRTASGEVTIEDSYGEFEVSTASGNIKSSNIEGYVELTTASGDIDVSDSKGSFEFSCASGDISVFDVVFDGESSFSTASGRIDVMVSESVSHDLELSTASGNIRLNYRGCPIKGYFEFIVRKNSGRIISQVKFDDVEESMRGRRSYIKKSFTRGDKNPRICLRSESGKIILKK